MNMDWDLTPADAEEFQAALLSAFPNRGDLVQLVFFRLGENLEELVPGGTYANNMTNLIMWAIAHGKAWALLSAAHDKIPGNPKLHNLYLRIYQLIQPPSPPRFSIPDTLIKRLIDILVRTPVTENFLGRTSLLSGIPAVGLKRSESNIREDLVLIVEQLKALGRLSSGEWPLLILIDNVLPHVKGYEVSDQLSEVRQDLAQIYQEV